MPAAKPSVPKPSRSWQLYLLECHGGKLYAGISPDPVARFALHCAGRGAKFTRANPPLRILAVQTCASRSAALVAEHGLKKLRRPAKLLWARQHAWVPPDRGRSRKRAAHTS
jgi:putative endonuclease